jgi:NitT/TauT family transport system substrate-binding protein
MRLTKSVTAVLGAASILLATAACGGGDEDGGSSGDELVVMLPAPSGIAFYPIFVAQAKGYFGDDISIRTETADGSTAALQQVLSGQADVCLCSPGPALSAVNDGAEVTSIYTMYQSDVFSLVSPEGSDVTDIEDLRDTTLGVDVRGGGAESWVVALLNGAGLVLDEDYTLIATGSGAAPATAFRKDEISAYAAAFTDVATLAARDFPTQAIPLPGSEAYFDTMLVLSDEMIADEPELVEAFGRGVAMGTVYGKDNPDEVLDIVEETFPEEVEDRGFAEALLDATITLFELPDEAAGNWGSQIEERYTTLTESLVEQDYLTEMPALTFFDNEYVPAFNDFEDSEL